MPVFWMLLVLLAGCARSDDACVMAALDRCQVAGEPDMPDTDCRAREVATCREGRAATAQVHPIIPPQD